MKVSLWFYPNEQKKSIKTEKVPIYVRVILNGKKSEGRLYHAELNSKEQLLWDERMMRLADSKHMANKLINSVQKDFDDFVALQGKNLGNFSAIAIRDLLLGRGKTTDPTVLEYAEKYFTSAIEKNSNLSIGTKKNYIKANRHLKNFSIQKKKQALMVKELTSSLAIEFKDYLLCSNENDERKGMTEP